MRDGLTRHQRYNRSEKGHARRKAYYDRRDWKMQMLRYDAARRANLLQQLEDLRAQ